MSSCELCGAPEAQMTAKVEGVDFKVCRNCVKHGSGKPTSTSNYNNRSYKPTGPRREGPEQHLLPNLHEILRAQREKRGMSLEEFAKHLQEKESVVAKWESGSIKPPIPAAIRVGKLLGVYLIEREDKTNTKESQEKSNQNDHSHNHHSNNQHNNQKVSDEMTLGDFIKVKKR